MRFRDRIKFYKQRIICNKILRCIKSIKKYEPTIDGSFFSPAQLRALSQLHLLCDEIGCPKAAFVTNYALEIHEEDRKAMKEVLRLEGNRYKTARQLSSAFQEEGRKLGLEALLEARRISAEVHNPEGVVFRDVQRPEGFKEDKLVEV